MNKVREVFAPSLLGSIGSILIYKYILKDDLTLNVPFANMEVPGYIAVGVTSLAGNIAGEVLADIVIPKIPKIGFIEGIEKSVVPPVLAGAITYAGFKSLVSADTSLKNTVLVAIGGNVAGKYAYNMIY